MPAARSPLRRSGGAAAVLALALAGCARPQRPFVFSAALAPETATDVVASALQAEGHRIAARDARIGSVLTAWDDSGYRFREPDYDSPYRFELETHVYRRYRVAVVDQAGAMSVRLSVEAQRCVPHPVTDGLVLRGACTDLSRDLPGALQRALDALGEKLRDVARLHGKKITL